MNTTFTKSVFLFGLLIVFNQSIFSQHQKTLLIEANQKVDGTELFEPSIIWAEDFDSVDFKNGWPEGWYYEDLTGNHFNWTWSLQGPRGRLTSPNGAYEGDSSLVPHDPIFSPTYENGFIMLEADYYNTDTITGASVDDLINMNSFIQTPAIDFSNYDGAIIRLYQAFRYSGISANTKINVSVSNDFDPYNPELATWTDFDVKNNVETNDYSENPMFSEVNISDIVGGQSSVYLRFHMLGTPHHFWMIDDIEIIQPYDNDMIIQNFWADYMLPPQTGQNIDSMKHWYGGYYHIPFDLKDEFVSFRGSAVNMGLNTQTGVKLSVNISKDEGEVVYSQNSATRTINFFESAMFEIEEPFVPASRGHYQVSATIIQDQDDELSSNNTLVRDFIISDSVYSRTTSNPENYSFITTTMLGGDASADNICVVFDIPETDGQLRFSSVTTYIHEYFSQATVEAEDAVLIARIYKWDDEENNFSQSPYMSSELYTLTVDDIGDFLTLPVSNSSGEPVTPGIYAVGLEIYMYGNDPHFIIGNDLTMFEPEGYAIVDNVSSWKVIDANPVIWLNIVPLTVGNKEVGNTPKFTVTQNYPNPFNSISTIEYNLVQSSGITIEVYDMTGKCIRKLYEGMKNPGAHKATFNASNYKAGIYLYMLKSKDQTITRRMIVE